MSMYTFIIIDNALICIGLIADQNELKEVND